MKQINSQVDSKEFAITGTVELDREVFWADVSDVAHDEVSESVGSYEVNCFEVSTRKESETVYADWRMEGNICNR